VIPAQMPAPYLSRLLETYGDSSPMGLLWTFIGASKPYEIFCGSVEMLGGLLLFVPALTTLGALICVAAMGNVFLLNMCYDVPVKLMSLEFLVMALFLVTPDARRLTDLFIFHRTVRLPSIPLVRKKWLNRSLLALQVLGGFVLAAVALYGSYQQAKYYEIKPPHYGVWAVEEYVVDGIIVPPSLNEQTRWRRVILDVPERLTVQYVDAPQDRFFLKQDDSKKSLTLSRRGDPNWKSDLSYQETGRDTLAIAGQFDGHQIQAKLHRMDESKFPLTSRGFHWVNEVPYNR
jgi:hypothetical protein